MEGGRGRKRESGRKRVREREMIYLVHFVRFFALAQSWIGNEGAGP